MAFQTFEKLDLTYSRIAVKDVRPKKKKM